MATPKPIRMLCVRRIIEAVMLRRFLLVFVIVWLQASSAWAADPARHITQYAHTAWRMQDGAFNSAPWTIVQTPDGYMWIGTADGVLQFRLGPLHVDAASIHRIALSAKILFGSRRRTALEECLTEPPCRTWREQNRSVVCSAVRPRRAVDFGSSNRNSLRHCARHLMHRRSELLL
jgi:ligand-binding sensor domain-containing protein